uniref:hypothetical protein n=1 Tax=Exserohilum turcicum TaxID=93612 RepID=UPI0020007371
KLVFTEKILLYAGNSYLYSPLVFITLGTIYLFFLLRKLGQSAGNFGFSTKATAVAKNTYNKFTDLPLISIHVPNHKTILTDSEFGYFLAGLIEGDGWFGNKQLYIIFAEEDTSLAYYIKKRIGYGNVYKIKEKKAVRYVCKNKEGLSIILSLINGKLVSSYKYDQLLKHGYNEIFNITLSLPLKTLSLDNYWLAGFTQADGCFHISVVNSKTHKTGYSVRLEYSLKQNDELPLKLLFDNLKMGNVSQYSSGIWCYKSSGFKTAACLINYFDKFNLFAGKYKNYLKFRKVYIMITEGKHLEEEGIKKIQRKSKSMTATHTQSSCSGIFTYLCSFILLHLIIDYTTVLLSSDFGLTFMVTPCVSSLNFVWPKGCLPVKTYDNTDTQKLDILKDNREKSGIYLWENKINGNVYVGSSTNLTVRLIKYFNHLLKYSNMNICKALLKYGYSNFSLHILEYCESDKCFPAFFLIYIN